MRHLESCSLKTTFHIETLVRLGAVQDGLVAAYILRNVVQCLDDT